MNTMNYCNYFNPDNVFKRFKMIEFPISFVGLSTHKYLDLETNLKMSAYIKTHCNGNLMKFCDARQISPSHRAFNITQVDENIIQITFQPLNECISKAKTRQVYDTRFVIDLRLIQVDGVRCCNNELHSEIGRYYISGHFEYSNITHSPKVIQFGEVPLGAKVIKHVKVKNKSKLIAARFIYEKVTGFEVIPSQFLIPPNSSTCLTITLKPSSLKIKNTLDFKVTNPHDTWQNDGIKKVYENDMNIEDDNFFPYFIVCKSKIIYTKKPRELVIESLHKLIEPNQRYTFIGEKEINEHKKRKKIATNHLEICKSNYAMKPQAERFCTGNVRCYSDINLKVPNNNCVDLIKRLKIHDLVDILLQPNKIDFARVALNSLGENYIVVKNNTQYNVTITLQNDKCISYSDDKLKTMMLKINSGCETKVTVFALGFAEGIYTGTFSYLVNNRFYRLHPYSLQVGNPTLLVQEKLLRFGMTTSDSFITSAPVRIYNHFNVPIDFRWDINLCSELEFPFEIIPHSGTIAGHTCKICDVIYLGSSTKTKTLEADFVSIGQSPKIIPIELNVVTRKLSIKFLQQSVVFRDIPLNVETVEKVRLENASREIATFYVLDPQLPGLRIVPMSGIIRPKTIVTFNIIVKIPCILEFSHDIVVKINNKENVSLLVSGTVVEPKIIIHPKNIVVTRIPCGMITYIPLTIQNLAQCKAVVEILDTGDENLSDIYIAYGNEKKRIFEFSLEGGQSKTVFLKIMDLFRREYEMYIPFKINDLIGPPNQNSLSTELQYYIKEYESQYENNTKVKLKSMNKDISYCKLSGVITVPWVHLSVEQFEIEYDVNENNVLEFTMTNISKYVLPITIMTSKLSPTFSLEVQTEDGQSIINETHIKFGLGCGQQAAFVLKFHPKMHGRFVSTAVLFLDRQMSVPYYNLTFIGKRQKPVMTPNTYLVVFPPCYIGTTVIRVVDVKIGIVTHLDAFSCVSKDEPSLFVKFLNCEVIEEDNENVTVLTIEIKVHSVKTYSRHMMLGINHECGSSCEIELSFSFTHCVLTLHTSFLVTPDDNPYPYFPNHEQSDLLDYMTSCTHFLEKWMFQQGFRRDLYPKIPDTFYSISTSLSSHQASNTKSKGISVSYLSFMKRIAGPLMKYIHKVSVHEENESFKVVKEIHDSYIEILNLLRIRGSDLWMLQAKFLLSFDQFVIYSEHVTSKSNADIVLTQELLANVDLFYRLSKQCWIDFILQSYKVFVIESCFFDCVCVDSQPRNIVKFLIDWYNEHIKSQHKKLRGNNSPVKDIKNLTTDLTDGIAITSVLLTYCPFLSDHFTLFSEIENGKTEMAVISNACLIIEALNCLRMYFPICSKDFLKPNFLQMLFLSIHLFVVLPMFIPRDTIQFNPPLLRSSTRHIGVSSTNQETLTFTHMIIDNNRSNFIVEKGTTGDNGKKMFLNVKYTANFVSEESCVLLVHGYNKTRIFDTYIVFLLKGAVGTLNPFRKCKVTGSLYRPCKVDIQISSPFHLSATFNMFLTDIEPTLPVEFNETKIVNFYVRRLHLIDKEIMLAPMPKETSQEVPQLKVYMQLICLSTQVDNSWIWFRSDIGEFFVRVSTQTRWDLPVDTIQARVQSWPMDPCSCGEACECYRTTVLNIPHRNELMVKALRYSLAEHASHVMINIFDHLIETTTGKLILGMLLKEGGTNMSEVRHILRTGVRYRISSKILMPRIDEVVLEHYTSSMLSLPVTVPTGDIGEKFNLTFTSECGSDIRNYKIIFVKSDYNSESNSTENI